MASTLNITKQLSNDKWVITATISPGGTLPQQIFTYENTGTTELGEYFGVIAAVDLPRIQIWEGVAVPVFGNKYIRHSTGTLHVSLDDDPDVAISVIKAAVQRLSKTFSAVQTTVQVHTIT